MTIDKSTAFKSSEINSVDPLRWVELHADYMYNYTFTRINDEEQARDLIQETFLAALEKVAKFEGKSSERTWLIAILKNKIIDVYRKKASGLGKITDELKAEQEQHDFFEAADGHWTVAHRPQLLGIENQDNLLNKELRNIIHQCMQKLPALWLAIFTMKHIEDEATETICSQLKVTPANLWVIIHRAKLNLRACLQQKWL